MYSVVYGTSTCIQLFTVLVQLFIGSQYLYMYSVVYGTSTSIHWFTVPVHVFSCLRY